MNSKSCRAVKYLATFIFLMQAGLNFADTVQMPFIEEEHIVAGKNKIIYAISKRSYARNTFVGSLVALAGVSVYKIFNEIYPVKNVPVMAEVSSFPYPAEETARILQKNNALTIRCQQALARSERVNDGLTEKLAELGVSVNGKKIAWSVWLYGCAAYVGRSFGFALLNQIANQALFPFTKYFKGLETKVDGVVGYMFHDESLMWVTSSFTNFDSLFSLLNKNAGDNDGFINTWNLCRQQLCIVFGYMGYKSEKMVYKSEFKGKRLQVISSNLLKEVNDFIQNVVSALQSSNVEMITKQLNLLEARIKQRCEEFSAIEELA